MLETGQKTEIEIVDFGVNGEGIGKRDGFVTFIKGAVPGDRVLAEIYAIKKNRAFANIVKTLEYSKSRIEPACASFGKCGGCNYLHIDYETELKFKKKSVNDALKRIGGVDFEIDEIIGMDEPCFYRNKAVYHVSGKNGIKIGFYGAGTHDVVPVGECVMFSPENVKILAGLKEYMNESGVLPYDAKTGKGLIESVTVRRAHYSGDVLVAVGANCKKLPNSAGLVYHLTSNVPNVKGITLFECGKGHKADFRGHFVWGDGFVTDKIGDCIFKVSASSFFQVNSKMTSILYEKVREYSDLSKKATVIDAYSGICAISIFISGDAKDVIGIEISKQAVTDAEENAELNGVSNIRFINGEAGTALCALSEEGIRPYAVVLDPPRSGCGKDVFSGIKALKPERIVYVSCAPATLARDLKEITAIGYAAEKGVCVDMFARCAHVETVVLLSKLKSTSTFEVKADLDEMDLTKSESKGTYDEIKQYVFDRFGFKVSQPYISQVKRKHGIIERSNYNIGEGKSKVPQVPPDKEKAIEDALRHFQMI